MPLRESNTGISKAGCVCVFGSMCEYKDTHSKNVIKGFSQQDVIRDPFDAVKSRLTEKMLSIGVKFIQK